MLKKILDGLPRKAKDELIVYLLEQELFEAEIELTKVKEEWDFSKVKYRLQVWADYVISVRDVMSNIQLKDKWK